MLKFATYGFAIVIGITAFGPWQQASAALACGLTDGDQCDVFFTADTPTVTVDGAVTLDSMFTAVDIGAGSFLAIDDWMFTDPGLVILAEAFGLITTGGAIDFNVEFASPAGSGFIAQSYLLTATTSFDWVLRPCDGAGTFTCDFGQATMQGTYVTAAKVPEPSTMFLFGIGLIGLVGIARRRRGKDGLANP